jgi:hypothetical protein
VSADELEHIGPIVQRELVAAEDRYLARLTGRLQPELRGAERDVAPPEITVLRIGATIAARRRV